MLFVGTIRRDGVVRISGVEPLIMDGQLLLSMMRTSAKALDLQRDPRIVLNSIVIGPEPAAEIKIRGSVHAENNRLLPDAPDQFPGVSSHRGPFSTGAGATAARWRHGFGLRTVRLFLRTVAEER